jgi:hypothetical protein
VTTIYLSLIAVSSFCICQPAAGSLTENGSITVTGLKNNTTVVVKDSDSGDNITSIIGTLTAAGGIATVLIGFRKWLTEQQQIRISRQAETVKDVVLPLILEFDKSEELMIAKNILDDTPIGNRFYDEKRLSSTLRDHRNNREPWVKGDKAVRDSFDSLLDFFSKLEYLSSIDLLSQQQLEYFRYYIDKAAENNAVVNYVKIYNFPLHKRLHPNLNSKSPLIDTINNP